MMASVFCLMQPEGVAAPLPEEAEILLFYNDLYPGACDIIAQVLLQVNEFEHLD